MKNYTNMLILDNNSNTYKLLCIFVRRKREGSQMYISSNKKNTLHCIDKY